MARNTSGLKPPWPKGVSGNPNGRPSLPAALKAVRAFTADEIERIIAKYMRLSKGELQRLLKEESDSLPMFDAMICSILANAYKTGDFSKLNFLLDRSGHRLKDEKHFEVHQHNYREEEARKNEIVKRLDQDEVVRLLSSVSDETQE